MVVYEYFFSLMAFFSVKNLYLADEIILVVALCCTKFKEVLIEADTVPPRNWIA